MVSCLVLAFAVVGLDKLQPIDEAPQDKQFLEFRTNMIAAIKKKNYSYVNSRIDEDVHWSFGGGEGRDSLLQRWKEESSIETFYDELLQVLKLGGQFGEYGEPGTKSFTAPYSFSAWPDEFDAYEYVVAVNKGVLVYAKPDTKSGQVGTLSYDIVKVSFANDYVDGWHEIELPNESGKTGWVERGPVRSPISYRAIFEKKRGSWYMVMFIAGD
ncbi:MAG: SH3 domain-containing protein [Armatimonadetes bacterium]|nr:SH3 domain-containing protein [Armatimonadota bacterium]